MDVGGLPIIAEMERIMVQEIDLKDVYNRFAQSTANSRNWLNAVKSFGSRRAKRASAIVKSEVIPSLKTTISELNGILTELEKGFGS